MSSGTGSVEETVDTGFKTGRIAELMASAHRLVQVCTHVKPGESVLIVTDSEVSPLVTEVIAGATLVAGGIPFILTMPQQVVHGAEPPAIVAQAMLEADVIFGAVSKSITHTKALRVALEQRGRYLGLSSITEDALIRGAATADPAEIRSIGEKLRERLVKCQTVRVTSQHGMDVTFSVEGRPIRVSDGVIPESGTWQGERRRMFPDGECHTCPVEDSVHGVIVVDRWMQGVGLLDTPIRWVFEHGRCVRIEGGSEAAALRDLIQRTGDEWSNLIGEFAIGINPKARVTGNPHREGKKLLGSVHFALGTGAQLGGLYRSSLHLDGVALRPTVAIDGEIVIADGQLNV